MNLRANLFGRLATPVKPIMDNIFLETFFFFVPNRLVWDNWQKFNGEQTDPADSTAFTIPTVTGNWGLHTLGDFYGIPTGALLETSALPFRGHNLIFNEWFRDQNLIDSLTVATDDGPDNPVNYVVKSRGKRHDYFTSCLPWPQKNNAGAVTVPLGTSAPVTVDQSQDGFVGLETDSGPRLLGTDLVTADVSPTTATAAQTMYADLSAATGFTINQLRQSFQIQKLYERDARGGTRYTEIVRSHFGVISPDARLQRPEFLGGGSQIVNINPVANTSDTAGANQGDLAGFGTVLARNHGFTKSFTEHGYIHGFVNFRADLTYQQGLNRMWSRSTRFDFYWPALAHIGEQAVLNKEIYADASANDDLTFGYQERYGEMRYAQSQICGLFRSQAASSIDVWHLAQEFGSLPTLGETFITDAVPLDRAIAVPSEPHFLLDIRFNQRWARPMPLYGVPGLIDHF